MGLTKGGYLPGNGNFYRIEYIDKNGHIAATIDYYLSIDALKEIYRSVHKDRKILAICLAKDYREAYEKYSDIMNPVEYKR